MVHASRRARRHIAARELREERRSKQASNTAAEEQDPRIGSRSRSTTNEHIRLSAPATSEGVAAPALHEPLPGLSPRQRQWLLWSLLAHTPNHLWSRRMWYTRARAVERYHHIQFQVGCDMESLTNTSL